MLLAAALGCECCSLAVTVHQKLLCTACGAAVMTGEWSKHTAARNHSLCAICGPHQRPAATTKRSHSVIVSMPAHCPRQHVRVLSLVRNVPTSLLLLPLPLIAPVSPGPLLLGFPAASLSLPGAANADDPSAATIYQRALERQTLYADLATQMQRQGLLLGHEIMGSTTQSQVFDRVSKPGHWKKPTVKPILHKLEVRWLAAAGTALRSVPT